MKENFPLISGSVVFDHKSRLAKNVSLFKEDGTKVYWGDLSKKDLKKLKKCGLFYVLSEYKSYWQVPKEAIMELGKSPFHNINALRFGLGGILEIRDKIGLMPRYIKENKIALVQDGIWIRDDEEWLRNYS